jgi:hypothetical protein
MRLENTIVLAATTCGSIYLCAKSLEQINKNKYDLNSASSYCNFFIFGFSSGIFMCITSHILKSIDN